jgi:phosphoribosylformylglycinamidine synthase
MSQTLAPAFAAAIGLPATDYDEICRRLGRTPNPIEARMFGVMWSEHCGYKHSRRALRRLPSRSPRVLSGPGENAGVVSLGAGWAVAFKMESHNHPSAVDPYNGAATGVGGIIRDVLAMGARPIAVLDSLRFGLLTEARPRRLAGGVVAGIAGYGNAIGVPTVGGELLVHTCYRDNPLVNVACVGLVRAERIATAAASGPGNAVLYAGARTGRDGIGGAAFASTELDEAREREDRASVQMGDPFTGKLLIEATLEALATGAVVAIQDMGAGGLTCASGEMAARGGVGMTLELDRVPLREAGMRAEEILLSESQERMLLVVRATDAEAVAACYHRWGLAATVVGEVSAEPRLRVLSHGAVVVDLPPEALANAPTYEPRAERPADLERYWQPDHTRMPWPSASEALLALLRHPDVATKRAVFEQYDFSVGVRTITPPGHDAAVLRVIEAPPLGLAVTADGNARWCAADPRRGAALIVLEAAANLASAGADPIAVTDCLNFGNPERPEVFWTFREVIEGMAEACEALGVPVTGGNVSFYNEAEGRATGPDGETRAAAIVPTPIVGMVGALDDVARHGRTGFVADGDAIVLLGQDHAALGASLYLSSDGHVRGRPATPVFADAVRALRCAREAVHDGLLASAHDCSDGGLAVALAECCLHGGVGATVQLSNGQHPSPEPGIVGEDAVARLLFGEGPGRFIASVAPRQLAVLQALAATWDVPFTVIGTVGGERLRIATTDGVQVVDAINLPLTALANAWESLEV